MSRQVLGGTLEVMRTVLVGDPPVDVQRWLERRRALGQDGFDEVWEGEYHVAPMAHGRQGRVQARVFRFLGPEADAAGLYDSGPLNLGGPDNYRVPDGAYLWTSEGALWNPTAAIVVEIVSPGDESRDKFAFYFDAGVEEALMVDPEARTIEWFVRSAAGFVPAPGSMLLGVTSDTMAAALAWPD